MSFEELVRRAIAIDEEEIMLWSEIAAMVRSRPLREAIMRLVETERENIAFWRSILAGPMTMAATTQDVETPGAGERSESYLHHRIRQALMTNLQEISLFAEIASRAPSDVLRLVIILRIPEEVSQVVFWNTLLLARLHEMSMDY